MTQPNQDAGEELLHKLERESHCRTYAGALAADALAEIRRLQSIVEKLPKDAQGNAICAPQSAWRVNGAGDIARFEIDQINPGHTLAFGGMAHSEAIGSGWERWQSHCVFIDHAAAVAAAKAAAKRWAEMESVAAAAPGEGK